MCGISGFNFPNEERIRQMNAILAHRGPDDSGFFVDDNISLGHTRLAIIDLSPTGHQPMSYRGRYVIAFNGEIYNYRELKRELQEKGHEFASDSDTEVILAAYAEYGADCISRLNGIFAFAIWDNEEKKLALARDQIGVKPLYYHWDGSRLIFASEIKAIFAHPEVRCEVDWKALNLYLRVLYVPAPRTMFANIRKLEAGTMAVLTREQLEFKRYWEPNDWTDIMDYQAAKEDVRRLTADAVRRQLISDRPVGIFLSGGIDSSIVTGLMCRETASRVKTFSLSLEYIKKAFVLEGPDEA